MADPLSTIESDELESRLQQVLGELDVLFKEIGPKVRTIGNLREEAQLIYQELDKRGLIVQEKKDVERPVLQGQVPST